MEEFKIDHFVNEKNVPFPHYDTLSSQECKLFRDRLIKKLALSAGSCGLTLVCQLTKSQTLCREVSAEDEQFSLQGLVNSVGICAEETVFINWYRFDNIDRMSFADFSDFFEDIWYPGPDDIDIFDSSLTWVLSVTHYGCIQYVKFS